MPDLLYFMPDTQIPDADLLGYGDLVYSDGTTRYLNGDPEIAMGLPTPPPGVQPQGSLGMGPPAPPEPAPGMQLPQAPTLQPQEPAQPAAAPQIPPPVDLGNGMGLDMMGNIVPMGQPTDVGNGLGVDGSGNLSPMQPMQPPQETMAPAGPAQPPQGSPMGGAPFPGGGAQPEPLMGADGRAYQLDITGQFVPVERQGAMPQDVAQRQLAEMGQQNTATLQATEQARRDEARMMNELTLQQMAQLEVQRVEQERQVAEEQAKVQRWQEEQQALADMQIEDDLISAAGPVGGILGAIGAALMGAAGNDMGFRMIENRIDRHVRAQVQRRDTKLNLLAQQIGSSQQAIKMGKAAIYEAAARKAELLAQKTKGDVFEAQTPAVIEQLRAKQLENMQAAEKDSLGKLIERVATPPKPPSEAALQKYGELRRERDASVGMAQRIEQQIGLAWTPGKNGQPGHYANRDEVLKQGVQGVGNLEQWLPDFVYSTMGGTTAEGYQVRGAAEALAYATIRQMQPTGPISNADIKAAVKANALNTEEGLIRAVERIRTNSDAAQAHDSAQFGADVVTEYNRRFQQAGGQLQTAAPAASRPATPEEMRGEAQRRRQPQQQGGGIPEPTPQEFRNSVIGYAEGAGLNPDAVMRVIGHESGGKPAATNKLTGKHAGLIQFSQQTWAGLAREAGTPDVTWEDMRKMSAEEQLPYVMLYFNRVGLGPDNDAGDYAMAAFMPAFWQQPDDFVLGRKGSSEKIGGLSMAKVWQQNPGLRNGDTITVGDVRRSVGG